MNNTIVLFMGSEASGLYTLIPALKALKMPYGFPYMSLRNRSIVRNMPHSHLNVWTAIRRIYTDTGFAPIAEIPDAALSPEAQTAYVRLFARVFAQLPSAFLTGDHLASLALPYILKGCESLGRRVQPWLFFSDPGNEAALLRQRHAQPEALSEYLWLTTTLAALRHTGTQVRLVDTDAYDAKAWRNLLLEVSEALGMDLSLAQVASAPVSCGEIPLRRETCNPYVRKLHHALKETVAARMSHEDLQSCVQECSSMLNAFSGWQYADCLDLGEMDTEARRLLARAQIPFAHSSDDGCATNETYNSPPETCEDLLSLLEEKEAELLAARRDYDTRIFLHSDAVHRHYMHCLQTEKKIFESRLQAEAAKSHRKQLLLKKAFRKLVARQGEQRHEI